MYSLEYAEKEAERLREQRNKQKQKEEEDRRISLAFHKQQYRVHLIEEFNKSLVSALADKKTTFAFSGWYSHLSHSDKVAVELQVAGLIRRKGFAAKTVLGGYIHVTIPVRRESSRLKRQKPS